MTYNGKWLKNPSSLLFDVRGSVLRLQLNRPDKRNALSNELLAEIRAALLEADDRTDINVIVIEGLGKDFSAGYDMPAGYAAGAEPEKPAHAYRTTSNFDNDVWSLSQNQAAPDIIFDIHKPVIAKVHGNCLAGGADLALRCDLVIAADDARIGFPATRANGSPPSHMWTYLCGAQWAKRLLMTGDMISGRDAARIGLVLDAVPVEELEDYVAEVARRISLVDPELASTQKRIVNLAMEAMGRDLVQGLAVEMNARAHLAAGPRRTQFKKDMKEHGFKTALKNRDEPFGDGMVRVRRP